MSYLSLLPVEGKATAPRRALAIFQAAVLGSGLYKLLAPPPIPFNGKWEGSVLMGGQFHMPVNRFSQPRGPQKQPRNKCEAPGAFHPAAGRMKAAPMPKPSGHMPLAVLVTSGLCRDIPTPMPTVPPQQPRLHPQLWEGPGKVSAPFFPPSFFRGREATHL